MKFLYSKIFLLFLFSVCKILAQNDTTYPSWIKYDFNYIYFKDSEHLKNTLKSWGKKDKSFTVLHIGDSHLQNENLPNQSRKMLQNIQGDGGIGFVVPFSTVKTYDARFYKSTHTGEWRYSKSYMNTFDYPMGVRGMTSNTSDSNATFKISFFQNVSSSNNELVVFRNDNGNVFDINFFVDDKPAVLKSTDDKKLIYNVFGNFSTLSCKVVKNKEEQKDLTITGLILQDSLRNGGVWHNAGVGAAPYRMILSEDFYHEQAQFINPDLIIIDLGTNDFLYSNQISPILYEEITRVIEKVRKANPMADIILTDAQEMMYKGKRTTVAKDFSEMMYDFANKFNCGFWSYYRVSGGENVWNFWDAAKMTQGDGIHLNGKGSELKGKLLFEAINNSVNLIRLNKVNFKILEGTPFDDHTNGSK